MAQTAGSDGLPKLCPKCGAIYSDDDRFCHIDGTKLEDHPVSPPPTGSHPVPVKIDRDKYLGQTLLDQFEVFEVCGSGSMGTVYKAHQKQIERVVAIKILHPQLANQPEAVLRFHREAKVISNLNHPNIVHIYLFGHLSDGNLYIVQEFVDGRSMAEEILRPFSVPRTIHIAKQVLSAIGEAHAVGVIHRDLKPENIMLTRIGDDDDFVKILDFGVAKKIVTQTFATREGLIFGSPKYISPEAAMGEKIDARSDLYSLGVMMYQMLAGKLPFKGTTPIELLMEHINAHPPPLRSQAAASDVPVELEGIVMRMFAKDPEKRYATAMATRDALNSVERLLGGRMAYSQAREPRADRERVMAGDRVHTAQAADSFTGSAADKGPPTVQDSSSASFASYSDYTTQEDVIGTQELYALQMRREKTKKIVTLAAVVLAVPLLLAAVYYGYRFMKNTFFPYDKVSSETTGGDDEAAGEGKDGREEAGPKEKDEPKEAAGKEKEAGEQAEAQAEITIENEEIPVVGTPVKFLTLVTNESGAVPGPHYLIKRSDNVEMKLSAVELIGAGSDGKRRFAAEYAFTASGPYIITFASGDRKYSPSVRIHIQDKSAGKKKKKTGKEDKQVIIKEIDEGKEDKKPSIFGPDLVAPPGKDEPKDDKTDTGPSKGIKIIEQPTPEKPPDNNWY
jgi:serine/threonine protein kinase